MSKIRNMLSNLFKSRKEKSWSATETQSTITIGGTVAGGTSGTLNINHYKPLPIIGKLETRQQYFISFSIVVFMLSIAGGSLYFYYSGISKVNNNVALASNLQTDIEKIAKNVQRLSTGDVDALAQIKENKQQYRDSLQRLKDSITNVASLDKEVGDELERLSSAWKNTAGAIDQLDSRRADVVDTKQRVQKINKLSALMYERVDQIEAVNYQELNSKELSLAIRDFRVAAQHSQELFFKALNTNNIEDINAFKDAYENVSKNGNGLNELLKKVDNNISKELNKAITVFINETRLVDNLYKQSAIKTEISVLTKNGQELSQQLDVIKQRLNVVSSVISIRLIVAALFALLGLASFGLVLLINLKESQRLSSEAIQEKSATEGAIMRLLDEIGELAEGDLRVRAVVTEEITGAIADSVNFAILQLTELVSGIQTASTQIAAATTKATTISSKLLELNEQQSRDILETGKQVLTIAEAVELVAERIEDSKKVASQSVESSTRGLQAVSTSIENIRSIQSNVDETGKRIRRLTEQSKQISEIVDLIGDISERTSVLAINATVQATKAGAAGKGFKVVADAVQDLSNQASEATRKIGALINAIQTDIQGAGHAMEQTTQEANRGAELAEVTGQALAEINDISLTLSDIVSEINEQVRGSAEASTQVSGMMKKILDGVKKSSDSTIRTNEAIQEIRLLSEQLKNSVEGFKI